MRKFIVGVSVAGMLVLAACSTEELFPTPWIPPNWQPVPGTNDAEVTLAAGLTELQPEVVDNLSSTVNLSRLWIASFDRVYELETPANEDFSFNIVARGEGNFGWTQLGVGHVEDAGVLPAGGVESIAGAGMTIEAPGLSNQGMMVHVNGDGFARATIRGRIAATQTLYVAVPRATGMLHVGIRVSIGNTSAINLIGGNTQGTRPGLTTTDIYSSDALQFGLPAIAVSGDRFSMVTYDGDPTQQSYVDRRRRWLQLDQQTGAITGADAESYSPDSGFWRDQEVAALGNVLAVAYTGCGNVRAEISLDRGATFPIVSELEYGGTLGTRLVQIAMRNDYRMGVLYWRNMYGTGGSYTSQLVLVEATPTAFDTNNTPTGYTWGTPQVVHAPGNDVTPLLMHMEYSTGGDLVVGYGYTDVRFNLQTWQASSTTSFRCAVRMNGTANFQDSLLDQVVNVMPCDPHVCLLGSGATMEIFYAYEKADGVHLMVSSSGGANWQLAASVPVPGAMMPSVHARMQNGEKRVDMLYMAPFGWGMELHDLFWQDFALGTAPAVHRVTQSTAVSGAPAPTGMPAGMFITTLAWFGYDALVVNDDLVIVTHELTYNSYEYYWAQGWQWNQPQGGPMAAGASSGGSGGGSSTPPPTVLLPGMTGSVPTPDPAHRNQLRVHVLD